MTNDERHLLITVSKILVKILIISFGGWNTEKGLLERAIKRVQDEQLNTK